MSQAVRAPTMTREAFFVWAEAQEGRYEFDGFEPVAMVGGLIVHSVIIGNLHGALRERLRSRPCRFPGPDAGVATIGDVVRYPDAAVTCSPLDLKSRLLTEPVVVFEVISPTSGRNDRIVKLREYRAVASIRRYVIVESAGIGVTVHERAMGAVAWTTNGLDAGETLELPEIDIAIPVDELYADTGLLVG